MNLHTPQNLNARTELEELMHVNKLLVNPANNKNTMGIVCIIPPLNSPISPKRD